MLGRLIQTATTYSRGGSTLESATEESHTRNLLYGQSQHVYPIPQSPPTSPHAPPPFRPGSFDDRGGLELEEKDVRILIAQDASGVEEKPTLLFDSRPLPIASTTLPSHTRHASLTGSRVPLPSDWKSPAQHNSNAPADNHVRGRSSTMVGGTAPWSRPVRDMGTREEAFLECMFGVTSSTKAAHTTKMHILPGKSKPAKRPDVYGKNVIDLHDHPPRRAPLHRARTSNTVVKSQYPPPWPGTEADSQFQDSILITRLFNVAISETVASTSRAAEGLASTDTPAGDSSPLYPLTPIQSPKKPKLVERKVPAFAIGLVINLPRLPDASLALPPTRPASRSAQLQMSSSTSSSYGSDMQSSWSFLNAIPDTLAPSGPSTEESDRRIETIVNNEDVILRAVALLEAESVRIVHHQLQKVLDHMAGTGPKTTPKEKFMQRTNQQIISISDPTAVSRARSLQDVAKRVIRRIIYALRVPRVIIGLGFGAGHWSDEARAAFRICGRRQQNFFLFTLVTTFLGHHTQWLQRLAPEWYRKQYRANSRHNHAAQHSLCQRTIIVSDQRAIARRLIFLLSSFLPGVQGMDGLQKPSEELAGSHFSMSSPSSHVARNSSLRRAANRRMRETRLHVGAGDKILSTSVDSADSMATVERPQRFLARRDSDTLSFKHPSLQSANEVDSGRKVSATTGSALGTHPTTPVAVFSTKRGADSEGYFPSLTDTSESMATAGLANILRRNSSSHGTSSNMSSRWGSLMSGFSDIWSNKQYDSLGSGNMTIASSVSDGIDRRRSEIPSGRGKPNTLQDMVNQLERGASNVRSPEMRFAGRDRKPSDELLSPPKPPISAPRLKVDDQDGVVDVDLDLPGFHAFGMEDLFKTSVKDPHRTSGVMGRSAAGSIRSLRSIPATLSDAQTTVETNVAGYLKRHHEDFCLQAVRPYPELEEEVKRSMLAEPSSASQQDEVTAAPDGKWIPISSTIIADLRTFSVRRLTLKRRSNSAQQTSVAGDLLAASAVSHSKKGEVPKDVHLSFHDEEIKDFDATLADAIEKVLDIGDAVQGSFSLPPRRGHSRTASTSTARSTPPSATGHSVSAYTTIARDYIRQDCRQVVLGALEEIVKDVCNDLSKLERGRDIHETRPIDASAIKDETKQENILRAGVKSWLLDQEQPRVY